MRTRWIPTGAAFAALAIWMVVAAGGHAHALAAVGSLPMLEPAPSGTEVVVYKSATCGCCTAWVEHMREHGFEVTAQDVPEMGQIKTTHGVPSALRSCHTAIVDGYVIEGHVPADAVERLLEERPGIVGLAVPGMPMGSPGMEMPGSEPQPYDVVAWIEDGATSVYDSR